MTTRSRSCSRWPGRSSDSWRSRPSRATPRSIGRPAMPSRPDPARADRRARSRPARDRRWSATVGPGRVPRRFGARRRGPSGARRSAPVDVTAVELMSALLRDATRAGDAGRHRPADEHRPAAPRPRRRSTSGSRAISLDGRLARRGQHHGRRRVQHLGRTRKRRRSSSSRGSRSGCPVSTSPTRRSSCPRTSPGSRPRDADRAASSPT